MGVGSRPCFELDRADVLAQAIIHVTPLSLHIGSVVVEGASELISAAQPPSVIPDRAARVVQVW